METIALLIRKSSKFDESISSIAHMYQPGTNLKVFLLGMNTYSEKTDPSGWLNQLKKPGIELYTDTPGLMESYGFRFVNKMEIARLITHADIVIPS
jgi:hypothetical protein